MIVPREHESTRIEAFSDAMFAFASTLLVVSLEVPRDFTELMDNLRGFFPFALSFAALYFIWVSHTNVFRRYALGDPFTLVVNGVLLFTVLFYVYPLKFMASVIVAMLTGRGEVALRPDQVGTLFIIYGCGWTLVFLSIALLYQHASSKREELGITQLSAYDAITHSRFYLAFAITGLISVLLTLLGVGVRYGVPGYIYAIVGIFAAINGSNRRKGREKLEAMLAGHPQLADTAGIRTPPKPSKSRT
jgi:uncharacterized membrane protein